MSVCPSVCQRSGTGWESDTVWNDFTLEGGSGGGGGLAGHSQLLLELVQLPQADVVAPTHHHHHGPQVAPQLPLLLQAAQNTAVHCSQGGATRRLHQDLLVICTETEIQVSVCVCEGERERMCACV